MSDEIFEQQEEFDDFEETFSQILHKKKDNDDVLD